MQLTPHFTLQNVNQNRNGYSDWITEASSQICTFNHISHLLCWPAYVWLHNTLPRLIFHCWDWLLTLLRPGALWKTWHASHPLLHRPCSSLPLTSTSPLPTSPSCLSLIKVKVAQGLLMLQMVAQVLTTPRSRIFLPQTRVTPPFSISLSLHHTLSLSLKMLFLH